MLFTLILALPFLSMPQDRLDPSLEASLETPAAPQKDLLLIHGGRIHLGNVAGGVAEALLVEDGRVVATGSESDLRRRLAERNFGQIDLRGAVAVPGLQDSHADLQQLGARLRQLDLSQAKSYEDLVARVAAVAEATPPGHWILGAGWNERSWGEGELPGHTMLSSAVPSHPVLLERAGGHAVLVNQAALELAELAGVLEVAPRVQGGRVLIDSGGAATGVLLDKAIELVREHAPVPQREERMARILAAQEHLLAQGVTCVQEMGVTPETIELYEELLSTGQLQLRVVAYLAGNAGLSRGVLEAYPRRLGTGDELSVQGVFFCLDGSLDTRGAALLSDYSDAPGERGYLFLTEERLVNLVHEAWQAGLQPAIGAVGDRANRLALDVYERMSDVDESFSKLRPRIEHAQVLSTAEFSRMPEHGVVPSMQPGQSLARDAWLAERLGPHRSRGAFAWRSIAPGLMNLAFGSGAPHGPSAPLLGIHAARTRRSMELLSTDDLVGAERLDGRGALAGFTRGAAHAVHQEDRRGQLLPGFWADLTVCDKDPVEGEAEELLQMRVLLTLVNGRVVYRR
jgi:predicted amidohydrolase YtcJ